MSGAPKYNTKSPTIRRILREAQEISNTPSADFTARPLEQDLFEWHFTLRGPPEPSPYAGGFYHGRILLPPTYPHRPPTFRFLTPSARFEVNRDICLSMSAFHEETWQAAWGIRTALLALRAFMDTPPDGQVGGMESGEKERKELAKESVKYQCPDCGGGGEEEAFKAFTAEQLKKKDETEIPPELKFGYKDEMQKKKMEAEKAAGEVKEELSSLPATTEQAHQTQPTPTTSTPETTTTINPQIIPGLNAESTATTLQPTPTTASHNMQNSLPQVATTLQSINPLLDTQPTAAVQTQQQTQLASDYQMWHLAYLHAINFATTINQQYNPQVIDHYTRAIYTNMLTPPSLQGLPGAPMYPHTPLITTPPAVTTTGLQPARTTGVYGVVPGVPAAAPLPPPAIAIGGGQGGMAIAGAVVGVGAAPAVNLPVHTFLHPGQDRGTAWLDIAIGALVGLLAIVLFQKI